MKILSLVTVLVLSLSVLAGCSSTANEESSVTESSIEESSAAEESSPEDSSITEESSEEDSSITEESSEEEISEEDSSVEEAAEIVAEVTAIAEDGTLTLSLYTLTADASAAEYAITDYATADLTNYEDAAIAKNYIIAEDALIQAAADGTLTPVTAQDIIVGDMLIIYTDDAGIENIVIYPTTEE